MLFKGYSKLSLIIVFGVAAVSDWFDGFFARRLNQKTSIGARMDQVIDRIFTILIVGALLFYVYSKMPNRHFIVLLVLISSREIIGLPAFLIRLIRGRDAYAVKYIGKITTFVQSIALGFIILGVSWGIYPAAITCILGIVSGFDYLKDSLS